jgi:hypothetical protein
VSLSPELRQRILEEERFRIETQVRIREEIRLRQQRTAFIFKMLFILMFFAAGYLVSEYYLTQHQAAPEVLTPPRAAVPHVGQVVLDEIARSLKPEVGADTCAKAIDRPHAQVKATIELTHDTTTDAARRLATSKVKSVGAILRKHGFAIPAYVEVISPKRWYGVAFYDSDTLQIRWDACPGRCEEEGTRYTRRCVAQ